MKQNKQNPEVIKLIKLSGVARQSDLANVLNVRPATISDYKTGKTAITVNTLKTWCKILNIDIKQLF